MQLLTSILAFSVCVTAIPASSSPFAGLFSRSKPAPVDDTVVLCEAAQNCETYTNADGRVMVRFKQGMGPGSDHYEKHVNKRDSNQNTAFRFSDTKLMWGCNVDPRQRIYDLIQNRCPDGQSACDETPLSSVIGYTDQDHRGKAPVDESLTLAASGHWPGGAQTLFRDGLTTSAQSVIHWDRGVNWLEQLPGFNSHWGGGSRSGSCDLGSLSRFIDMTIYNGDNLVGYMNVKADLIEIKSGFCNPLDLIGAVTGAIPGAGPFVAAYVGVIKALCQ